MFVAANYAAAPFDVKAQAQLRHFIDQYGRFVSDLHFTLQYFLTVYSV
jgi:hypothetical protein